MIVFIFYEIILLIIWLCVIYEKISLQYSDYFLMGLLLFNLIIDSLRNVIKLCDVSLDINNRTSIPEDKTAPENK